MNQNQNNNFFNPQYINQNQMNQNQNNLFNPP